MKMFKTCPICFKETECTIDTIDLFCEDCGALIISQGTTLSTSAAVQAEVCRRVIGILDVV